MKNEVLAIRPSPDNPNHNLWLNNGTWSVAYTVHLPGNTKKRIRRSLGTKDVKVARQRRQALFQRYPPLAATIAKVNSVLSVQPFIVGDYTVPVRIARKWGAPLTRARACSPGARRRPTNPE